MKKQLFFFFAFCFFALISIETSYAQSTPPPGTGETVTEEQGCPPEVSGSENQIDCPDCIWNDEYKIYHCINTSECPLCYTVKGPYYLEGLGTFYELVVGGGTTTINIISWSTSNYTDGNGRLHNVIDYVPCTWCP